MFEFARANWLWLFLLTLLFFVAYVLARRFRATRATYGQVWHTVARKLRPPAWKRVLRTLLTLLISGALLASVVLYAAGMQRPRGEQPPALMIAIALDCTPSMAAQSSETTRRDMAWARALEILKSMGEGDRAVVFSFERGAPVGSRWLVAGDLPQGPPPTDFAPPDLAALAEAVNAMQPPPGMATEPAPMRFTWWLGDTPPVAPALKPAPRLAGLGTSWRDLQGVPTLVETFGSAATNDAIIGARWRPAPQGPGRGTLEFETRSGSPVSLTGTGAAGEKQYPPALAFELAADDESATFRARVQGRDVLPQDDDLSFSLPLPPLSRAHIAWPAGDGEANPELEKALKLILPGVTLTNAAAGQAAPRHELLICDRAMPLMQSARFLLCFGVIPSAFGTTGAPVRVAPGLQRAEDLDGLDFEMPDLSLLQGDDVVPLATRTLRPLLKSPTGEVLIAEGTVDGARVLYCGFVPHRSTLLLDSGGFLLLMRWLGAIRAGPQHPWPPFVQTGATVEGRAAPSAVLPVSLLAAPWADCAGDRNFTLAAGPDGRATLGPLAIPGNWDIGGAPIAATWNNPAEQALPFEAAPPANLAALRPTLEADWRDHLPGLLLWVALGLLVLEWMLWLVGVTE